VESQKLSIFQVSLIYLYYLESLEKCIKSNLPVKSEVLRQIDHTSQMHIFPFPEGGDPENELNQ